MVATYTSVLSYIDIIASVTTPPNIRQAKMPIISPARLPIPVARPLQYPITAPTTIRVRIKISINVIYQKISPTAPTEPSRQPSALFTLQIYDFILDGARGTPVALIIKDYRLKRFCSTHPPIQSSTLNFPCQYLLFLSRFGNFASKSNRLYDTFNDRFRQLGG